MIKSIGKLRLNGRSRTGLLFIPAELMTDSAFPFKIPSQVVVKIESKKLVVEEAKA